MRPSGRLHALHCAALPLRGARWYAVLHDVLDNLRSLCARDNKEGALSCLLAMAPSVWNRRWQGSAMSEGGPFVRGWTLCRDDGSGKNEVRQGGRQGPGG